MVEISVLVVKLCRPKNPIEQRRSNAGERLKNRYSIRHDRKDIPAPYCDSNPADEVSIPVEGKHGTS